MPHGAALRLSHPRGSPPRWGLTDVWQGAQGAQSGPRELSRGPPAFPVAQRHQQRRSAPALRQKSERRRFRYFLKFSVRRMPKLCNSERMLGFGSPGDTGISAAVRRRTLPLGKFSHPPTLAVSGIAMPFPGHWQGAQGAQSGPRELSFTRGPPAFPAAQRHQQRRSAPALRQTSERKRLRYFRKFSILGMPELYIHIYIYIYTHLCIYIYIYTYAYTIHTLAAPFGEHFPPGKGLEGRRDDGSTPSRSKGKSIRNLCIYLAWTCNDCIFEFNMIWFIRICNTYDCVRILSY